MHLRVSAIIIETDALLAVAYDYEKGRLWHLPGGNPKEEETLSNALMRELDEELGIEIKVQSLAFVCEELRSGKESVIHLVFTASRMSGTPIVRPENTKAREVAFLPLVEITDLNLYPHIPAEIIHLSSTKVVCGKYLGTCPERDWL